VRSSRQGIKLPIYYRLRLQGNFIFLRGYPFFYLDIFAFKLKRNTQFQVINAFVKLREAGDETSAKALLSNTKLTMQSIKSALACCPHLKAHLLRAT